MMPLRVIIPAWGRLSPEMQLETGCEYPMFVPLGGNELYRHIMSFYTGLTDDVEFVFVIAEDAPDLTFGERDRVTVVRLTRSGNIGETVLQGLLALKRTDGLVLVQMADTLLELDGLPAADVVYAEPRSDLYRWTSIAADQVGHVFVLNDRSFEEMSEEQMVCVGLFSFTDVPLLVDCLSEVIDVVPGGVEPLFSAIEAYSRRRPMTLNRVRQWFDCGHIDSYYQSRLGYQNLRHFNSLTYGPGNGQVTKRSQASTAFRHQVRWFKQIPDSVASFLPRVYESSDGDDPFITMELLSIPTLGELFVGERLSIGAWNGVVRMIAHIQALFGELATPCAVAGPLARSIYRDKTATRLAAFLEQDAEAGRLWIDVAGERWDVQRVLDTLDLFVDDNGLLTTGRLAPIHGDFCFSNILFDTKLSLIKMIDPRGEFGVPGIFGDPRYDLAKLMHSFSGCYDFIVADRFGIETSGAGQLVLDIKTSEYHRKVALIFERHLFRDEAVRAEVSAIQALLFLSMLPYHGDKPLRQRAMLATGLDLYARSTRQGRGL